MDLPIKIVLPWWRKIMFGVGGYGNGILRSVMGIFQMAFLLEVAQLSWEWTATILVTEQVCDAFFDIIVGFFSDNFPTRFGRRKPWIIVAVFPSTIFWILSWLAPGKYFSSPMWLGLYFLTIYLLFSFSVSCVTVPYISIIPDIAPTPLERSIIVVIWQFFVVMGATSATFIWSSAIFIFPTNEGDMYDEGMPANYRRGYAVASAITGLVFLITTLVAASSVMERRELRPRDTFIKNIKKSFQVLRFPPFIVLVSMHCFSMLSITFFLSNIYLYSKYVLDLEEDTNFFILALQITIAISMFLWLLVSVKIDKNALFLVGSFLGWGALLSFFFAEPEWGEPYIYLIFIGRGCTASVSFVFTMSILPDVIELYYQKYNDRQEATFYGMTTFVEKLGIAVAFAASSMILGLNNYQNPETQFETHTVQPESAITALRYLVSICPIIMSGIAMFFSVLFYWFVSRSPTYKLLSRDDDGMSDFSDAEVLLRPKF